MLLAVDTSTQTLGIALYDAPLVLGEIAWRSSNHHTVELAPAVQELMHRCSVNMQDLQALTVALGPGSFTSLRIGLAFIKGLALSLHLPVVGVPTFDYLAYAQPLSEHPLLAILPAGRTRLAIQWYQANNDAWQPVSESEVLTPEQISDLIQGPTIICGELTASDRQIIGRKWKNAQLVSPALSARRASLLAELGWQRWQAGKLDDPVSLSPIYLHIAGASPE